MSLDKRSCMARAQALLADPSPPNVRYAALELRLCIEAITYEKLRAFASAIPDDVLKTWQPPQAVRTLLEFEPDADRSYVVRFGEEDTPGKPPATMRYLGTHNALKLNWLRKHYNKLGNVLHGPAPGASATLSDKKLTSYLQEVVADLQAPLASNITLTLRDAYHFECVKCKQTVVANVKAVAKSHRAACFNPSCKAEYFANVAEDGDASFQLVVTEFDCTGEGCDGRTRIENRLLDVGRAFECPKCGLKHKIFSREWGYGPSEQDTSSP